jgi:hypothetical protein
MAQSYEYIINTNNMPTMYSVPDIKPDITVIPSGNGMQKIAAINPHIQSRDKPDFVTAVAFAHRVRNSHEPVSNVEKMSAEAQSNPLRMFQYTEEDYDKIADYAVAYENAGGKRGPWSNIVSLVIRG